MPNRMYLDIMSADGLFIQQMRYTKRGFPELINGKIQEVHRIEDIEDFVYSKRPSLRGKNIRIEFTNQRVGHAM